jgi:hypothetical protein
MRRELIEKKGTRHGASLAERGGKRTKEGGVGNENMSRGMETLTPEVLTKFKPTGP